MLKNKKAISLVEVMVTAVILSVGIVMVIRSFLTVGAAFARIENQFVVQEFLNQKAREYLRNSLEDKELKIVDLTPIEIHNKTFYWQVAIADLIDDKYLLDKVKQVEITVSWLEANRERTDKLDVYLKGK